MRMSSCQPPWLARPVYGVAAPIIILVTLITNTFVVVVLSNKNLRTPTNHILLSMAITELMTGLSSSPWFLYYYTFGGLEDDRQHGLSDFWCKAHSYFAVHFPTIESPVMLTEYSMTLMANGTRYCLRKDIDFIDRVIGVDSWKAGLLCARAFLVHIAPCILLIIFTAALFKTVNEADRKRSVHQISMRKSFQSITSGREGLSISPFDPTITTDEYL
ncbi:hypothetical protein WR25_05146 [Diploscapter pachys]|uniref:G-protein coupled receptors family 1 profile domain-containing protein n=1 Tax=Diploscapter pachys TaxID=2018661 RepID=A0A2A2JI81_9BILA|nr:hypothetical protein WR25_05146 [Diploscapter pachys]